MDTPKIGTQTVCSQCGEKIVFVDPFWQHLGDPQPRHPAIPVEAPLQPVPHWTDALDSRELAQIVHARDYAAHHATAGAPGHGQFLLLAKLAQMLDDTGDALIHARGKPVIRKVALDDQGVWRDVVTGVRVDVP